MACKLSSIIAMLCFSNPVVSHAQTTLTASPSSLTFTYIQGGKVPSSQLVSVNSNPKNAVTTTLSAAGI
jgi:hypothetical protein